MSQITRFNRWFNSAGHWIYPSREAAAKVWIERGIACLEDAPQHTTVGQIINAGEEA